ncbi:hypothetical protein C0995_001306, partial [Termitomyces sp. Mi166
MHLIQPLPPFIRLSAPKNILLPALIPYIPAPKPIIFQFTSTRILATEEAEDDDSKEEPEQSVRQSEEPEELRNDNQTLTYDMVPWSAKAKAEEKRLEKVKQWLNDMKRPVGMDDKEYSKFICYATNFFANNSRLWKQNHAGAHKLVADPDSCIQILMQMHDGLGHRGLFATRAALLE